MDLGLSGVAVKMSAGAEVQSDAWLRLEVPRLRWFTDMAIGKRP